MSRKEKTFGMKIYSVYLCSVLLLTVIILGIFGEYSMYEFHEREENNIENSLNSVSQNLELQFAEIKKIRDAFYVNDIFKKAEQMNNPELYRYYDELELIELEHVYTMTLQKLMHTSSQTIRAIAFYPVSDNNYVYCLQKSSAEIKQYRHEDYQAEVWYQEIMEKPQGVVYYQLHNPEYIEESRLGPVYSYICGISNLDTHKLIGILKVDVDADNMQKTLRIFADEGESTFVLLKDGKIFAQGGELEKDFEDYVITKKEISNTGLEIACLNTYWHRYGGYVKLFAGALVIIFIAVLFGFMIYRKQTAEMVNDMNQVLNGVREIENGKLDNRIQLNSNSEYQKIANVINHMMDRLEEYIDREYILQLQQQKAQYLALQSQINPHFLYNTLNGFVALNRMGEKEILEKGIIELSSLFRYTCSTKDYVTVGEEMDFLHDYLRLEKLKYDESLEYRFDIDEECRYRQIPKLICQPIVENSIQHGRGNTDQMIKIWICAKSENVKGIGKVMILSVCDNGVGFDSEEKSKEDCVGLQNVRTRTELYCKNAIYQCVSKQGEGTRTFLVFPYEGGTKENDNNDCR